MKMKARNASISFRISSELWMDEKRFQELLGMFEKYRGVTDEVAFFLETGPRPNPPEDTILQKYLSVLQERMSGVRNAALRPGINNLVTLGHGDNDFCSRCGRCSSLTDISGGGGRGLCCPNDERMRACIRGYYETLAATSPDFIWIDDDVRLAGHGAVNFACFCDRCLALFAAEYGRSYTREALRKAFADGARDEKLAVRGAWLKHNRKVISRLLALIAEAAHRMRPATRLGFMTCDRFFEGYGFEDEAEALSKQGAFETAWRPGGGGYDDYNLRCGLLHKAHVIGRQVSLLPSCVTVIQAELENFPYEGLKKSAFATSAEAAWHITAGCTGAAFNVLPMNNEPIGDYEPMIQKLAALRPFYDLLVRELGRSGERGLYSGWNRNTAVGHNLSQKDWLSSSCPDENIYNFACNHVNEILDMGIPPAYSLSSASVTALSGNAVFTMEKKEILSVLSTGVYLDTPALSHLNEMGYGELTGFTLERSLSEFCREEMVRHPLNVESTGVRRTATLFNVRPQPVGVFVPRFPSCEVLARCIDYPAGREIGACCLGLFENKSGGRICVAGYYPWDVLLYRQKMSQIKAIMRWLSHDSLPAYVESYHKIGLWARQPQEGKLAVVLINTSFDIAEDLVLMVHTEKREGTLIDMCCVSSRCRSSGGDGHYQRFLVRSLSPWSMVLLIF